MFETVFRYLLNKNFKKMLFSYDKNWGLQPLWAKIIPVHVTFHCEYFPLGSVQKCSFDAEKCQKTCFKAWLWGWVSPLKIELWPIRKNTCLLLFQVVQYIQKSSKSVGSGWGSFLVRRAPYYDYNIEQIKYRRILRIKQMRNHG